MLQITLSDYIILHPGYLQNHGLMPLLSEYLNLSLMEPFISRKSKYLTISCSDVIGTETAEVSLSALEVILVTYENTFFLKEIENIFLEILLPKTKPLVVGII